MLLAVEGAGKPDGPPFLTMKTNSAIKGLTIFYPQQTNTQPARGLSLDRGHGRRRSHERVHH